MARCIGIRHRYSSKRRIQLDAAKGILNWIWPHHDGDITWPAPDSIEKIRGGLLGLHKGLSRGRQSLTDLTPGNVDKRGP
jgi:hypothetical protein